MKLLAILFTLLLVSFASYAGQAPQENPVQQTNKPPFEGPHLDAGGPISLIVVGALAAGAIATNPWIVIAVMAGIILLLVLLISLLIKKENPFPQSNSMGIGVYAFIVILIFALFVFFTALAIIGLSYLIGLISGASVNLLFGAAALAGIGLLWLLVKLIVHLFRVRKYKKMKKLFEYERA